MKTIFVLIIVLAVLLAPLAMLWMLNTLFSLHLPYDFKHWAAAALLCLLFGARSS